MYGNKSRFGTAMLLALVATLLLSLVGNTQPTIITLRSLAQQRGIGMGTAVLMEPFRKDSIYRTVLAHEFNWITPEYEMKFQPIHPEGNRYDFTAADALVNFAKENDMQVRGHTLIWHESLPNWLTATEWTRQELIIMMQQHINHVVGHYRGQLVAWDVVNEAIADDAELRKTIWLEGIGADYIEMAFRLAHAADPQARLFYNDYDSEALSKKSNAIYALVKDLRQRGVPIHGVGLQMHVSIKHPPNPEAVAANIKRLNELGLEVQITEMDVKIGNGSDNLEQRLATQAQVYRNMMRVCLEAENCTAFVVWGVSDRYSWIPRYLKQPDSPLIFDQLFHPKPAYNALVKALS